MKRTLLFLFWIALFLFSQTGTRAYIVNALQLQQDDYELLLPVVAPLYQSHPTLMLRYSGSWEAYRNSEELAAKGDALSDKLGLPAGTLQWHEGIHPVYAADTVDVHGVKTSLRLFGMEDKHQAYLHVTIETADSEQHDGLKARKQAIEAGLPRSGSLTWNTIIQGELKPGLTPDYAIGTIQAEFKPFELARYEDSRTVSISYYTDAKPFPKIKSGGADMNLQVAFHQSSETKAWMATIGTPIITTEY